MALEGGVRETKRKDRWFDADVDFDAVMRTAGREWAGLGWRGENWTEESGEEGTASLAGTQEGVDDGDGDGDVVMQESQV